MWVRGEGTWQGEKEFRESARLMPALPMKTGGLDFITKGTGWRSIGE